MAYCVFRTTHFIHVLYFRAAHFDLGVTVHERRVTGRVMHVFVEMGHVVCCPRCVLGDREQNNRVARPIERA